MLDEADVAGDRARPRTAATSCIDSGRTAWKPPSTGMTLIFGLPTNSATGQRFGIVVELPGRRHLLAACPPA